MTLTHRARSLRRAQTPQETRLWAQLRRRGLGGRKFHRQYVLGPYIVDFICLEERLVIELDGGQHDAGAARDAARTAWLQSQGFRVLRFWNTEVEQNLEGVIETICRASAEGGQR